MCRSPFFFAALYVGSIRFNPSEYRFLSRVEAMINTPSWLLSMSI